VEIVGRTSISRHDSVKNAIGQTLRSNSDLQVTLEPRARFEHQRNHPEVQRRRNDIRVVGNSDSGFTGTEYDVRVTSFHGKAAITRLQMNGGNEDGNDWLKNCASRCQRWLSKHRSSKVSSLQRSGVSSVPLKPLVFSAGGLMENETVLAMSELEAQLQAGAVSFMYRRISCSLVRARGRMSWDS
jgi:hypothetical protein